MRDNALQITERFAKALDAEEYAVAESLLGEECEYICRGERFRGSAEIIASYQSNGNTAKLFDRVRYQSEVVTHRAGQFRIRFIDHLSHQGHEFTFRCEQIVDVSDRGEIVRISHFDLPGQLEALLEFKKRCGVEDPECR